MAQSSLNPRVSDLRAQARGHHAGQRCCKLLVAELPVIKDGSSLPSEARQHWNGRSALFLRRSPSAVSLP